MRVAFATAAQDRAGVDPFGDLVAQARQAAVIWIAFRQQIAILGVKREQQAVQQRQRRFANDCEVGGREGTRRLRIRANQSANKIAKHWLEYDVGQTLSDLGFPLTALGQRELMKAASVDTGEEGFAPKHQPEQHQEMLAPRCIIGKNSRTESAAQFALDTGYGEQPPKIDLEIFLQPGLCALIIESPPPTAGQDGPLNLAIGLGFGARQVA